MRLGLRYGDCRQMFWLWLTPDDKCYRIACQQPGLQAAIVGKPLGVQNTEKMKIEWDNLYFG